jgi:hypothetical protein
MHTLGFFKQVDVFSLHLVDRAKVTLRRKFFSTLLNTRLKKGEIKDLDHKYLKTFIINFLNFYR